MKRLASILCTGLLLVTAASAFAVNTSTVAEPIEKGDPQQIPGGWSDTGGETIATATVIATLPYSDADNTCGHTRDYLTGPACGAATSPDLFYRYVPTSNQNVTISLCGSAYDCVLFVLENGVEIACNDDFCGLQSELSPVALVAGRTYVIGISGFSSGNCGPYTLNMFVVGAPPVICPYICPAGSQIEGEPVCGTNYVDNYNGGCNSTPTVFQPVTCGYMCGTTGTFLNGGIQNRDTDWFSLTVGPGNFTYNGGGEYYAMAKYVLDTVCPPALIAGPGTNCQPVAFSGPGSFRFFAGLTVFTGVPCGERYWVSWSGPGIPPCGPTATEPTTWGNIKNVYR